MSWIAITVADLSVGKAAALVDRLGDTALGDTQENPLPEIIAGVVARIRTEIKGCARNQLDVDETKIPRELKALAVRMIVREGQSRLNVLGSLSLSEDERAEQRNDLRYLERIAGCEVPISTPDNPVAGAVQASGNSPAICKPRREFGRHAGDGA